MKDKSGRKRNGTGMLLLNKDSAYGLRSETERENYFWPPLAMFLFFLSHTSLPYLVSLFLVFAQLCMIVGHFFVGICGKKKVTMNEEKRGQAEKCLGE